MTLRAFLAKRIIYTIVLILFVIVINFIIFVALPGYPTALYACLGQPKIPPQVCTRLKAQLGLGKPLYVQFIDYVEAILTFNFGYSTNYNQPVTTLMISSGRLENTLILLGVSTILAIIIGVLLGIVASWKRASSIDSFLVTSSLATFSLPTFFLGILFISIFAATLGWFPTCCTVPFTGIPSSILGQVIVRLRYLFLPALTLTLISFGGFLLLTRATMMESLSEDYITTARAKGLSQRVILTRHAYKNASLPIITSAALAFGSILGGAIITETVFNLNGLGQWLYLAVLEKDEPVMAAMFYIISLCVIAANFIADILYGIVDPRIKYE
jgi:peptide/nickel transport system permease protein